MISATVEPMTKTFFCYVGNSYFDISVVDVFIISFVRVFVTNYHCRFYGGHKLRSFDCHKLCAFAGCKLRIFDSFELHFFPGSKLRIFDSPELRFFPGSKLLFSAGHFIGDFHRYFCRFSPQTVFDGGCSLTGYFLSEPFPEFLPHRKYSRHSFEEPVRR